MSQWFDLSNRTEGAAKTKKKKTHQVLPVGHGLWLSFDFDGDNNVITLTYLLITRHHLHHKISLLHQKKMLLIRKSFIYSECLNSCSAKCPLSSRTQETIKKHKSIDWKLLETWVLVGHFAVTLPLLQPSYIREVWVIRLVYHDSAGSVVHTESMKI